MKRTSSRSATMFGIIALLAVSLAPAALAGVGPPNFFTYAHDRLYNGVLTPTELPNRGEFDQIFVLGSGLTTVADAAPGDQSYNGGRWEVHPVTFLTIAATQFTNAEQILAAAQAGQISIGPVVKRFECPLIPINQH